MQHNFGPPSFMSGQSSCPKCSNPVGPDEQQVACPTCFTPHHRNCVNEGVRCGNRGCSYRFLFADDGTPVFEDYKGPNRRDTDRRVEDKGAPDGVERRQGDRRRSDYRVD